MITEDEVINQTQESIAQHIERARSGDRGHFMQALATAWDLADSGNREVIRKAWPQFTGRCRHKSLVEIEVSWTDKIDPSEVVEFLGEGLVSEIATSVERTCSEVDINVESVRTV